MSQKNHTMTNIAYVLDKSPHFNCAYLEKTKYYRNQSGTEKFSVGWEGDSFVEKTPSRFNNIKNYHLNHWSMHFLTSSFFTPPSEKYLAPNWFLGNFLNLKICQIGPLHRKSDRHF